MDSTQIPGATYRPALLPADISLSGPHSLITRLNANALIEEGLGATPILWEAAPDLAPTSTPGAIVPIPVLQEEDARPKATQPDLLWLPIFWLPRQVAVFDGANLQRWHQRAANFLELSGLYDGDTGTWLDPLATILGLDITTPEVRARIMAWANGANDPDLSTLRDQVEHYLEANESNVADLLKLADEMTQAWTPDQQLQLYLDERISALDELESAILAGDIADLPERIERTINFGGWVAIELDLRESNRTGRTVTTYVDKMNQAIHDRHYSLSRIREIYQAALETLAA